jgi:hypothetical protein
MSVWQVEAASIMIEWRHGDATRNRDSMLIFLNNCIKVD